MINAGNPFGLGQLGWLRAKGSEPSTDRVTGLLVVIDQDDSLTHLVGADLLVGDVQYSWEIRSNYSDATVVIDVEFGQYSQMIRPCRCWSFRFLFRLDEPDHHRWLTDLVALKSFSIVSPSNTNVCANPSIRIDSRAIENALALCA